MQGIFNSRNLVIFVTLVVGMIIGASLAAYIKKDQVDVVDDAVNVVVPGNPLLLSDQFKAALSDFDAAGMAFVDDKGALQAVTIDGIPIALCGPGIPTCKLKISVSELIEFLAGTSNCQFCGGLDDNCHTSRNGMYGCKNPSTPCLGRC